MTAPGDPRVFGLQARLTAATIALVAAVAIVTQTLISIEAMAANGHGLWRALWRTSGYFTMLTNGLVALAMTLVAIGRWPRGVPTVPVLTGLAMAIGLVGAVYHTLLAQLWAPQGLQWWMDQALHTATPLLTALFWLLHVPKGGLRYRHLPWLLGWPVLYAAYALARGALDGWYPYPFMDVGRIGYALALRNAALLAGAMLAASVLVIAACRGFPRVREKA